jgi:hypothetical protein
MTMGKVHKASTDQIFQTMSANNGHLCGAMLLVGDSEHAGRRGYGSFWLGCRKISSVELDLRTLIGLSRWDDEMIGLIGWKGRNPSRG